MIRLFFATIAALVLGSSRSAASRVIRECTPDAETMHG